jgi:hypothetical protein
VLKLRISGLVLLLSPYAFLTRKGTTWKLQNLNVCVRVLKGTFVSEGEAVTRGWRNCIVRSFMSCTIYQISLGHQMKEDEMGEVCGMHGEEKYTDFWLGNLKE